MTSHTVIILRKTSHGNCVPDKTRHLLCEYWTLTEYFSLDKVGGSVASVNNILSSTTKWRQVVTTQRPWLSASCDNPRDKNALLEAGVSFFVLSTFDAFTQF